MNKLEVYEQLKESGRIDEIKSRFNLDKQPNIDTMYGMYIEEGVESLKRTWGFTPKHEETKAIKAFLALGAIDQIIEEIIASQTNLE
jgi:hypothetical protein